MTDKDFDKWFIQSYKPPSPTKEQLVEDQFRKEDASFYEALKAEERRKELEAREQETSESISDSEDGNLHEQIEEKLELIRRRRE